MWAGIEVLRTLLRVFKNSMSYNRDSVWGQSLNQIHRIAKINVSQMVFRVSAGFGEVKIRVLKDKSITVFKKW
jgi:hypothetical protein